LLLAALLAIAGGCAYRTQNPELLDPTDPPAPGRSIPLLKVHLRSGELYVLDSWSLSTDRSRIDGTGVAYSVAREPGESRSQSISVDEIALLEANTPETVFSGGLSALGVATTVLGGVTAVCIADPKSCFGSCPTFYVEGGDPDRPDAEGFSASIARVLEARDLDALFGAEVNGRSLELTMRNEALETHAVRRLRLLVVARPPGGRVLADPDGVFHPASDFARPQNCRAPEGSCLAAVDAFDAIERTSPADPEDLATRESIELLFEGSPGRQGIVVGARQTLLTTYLFYQTMAYLGRSAGEYLAALERGGPAVAGQAMGMARVLGGIEIEVAEAGGAFRPIGTFDEAGPIAGDVQVFPFESSGEAPLRVRLRLAKGLWRLGWVSLARLGTPIQAETLEPTEVERPGKMDTGALATLNHRDRHLVTVPGDDYRVAFALPRPGAELEFFLESEGYYYEWMRDGWLADEDPAMALLALTRPEEALRRLARPFKSREAVLDRGFESSRFRK
jgi:hypothetical protein